MYYIIIVLLIGVSAFFSSVEMAFSTCSKIRLKYLAAQGSKKAKKALSITDNFDRALTAVLVGNNIVNITAASVGTVVFTKQFGEAGVAVSTVVMTVAVLIFGEILPKSFAKLHSEKLCLAFAGVLNVIIIVIAPVSSVFALIQRSVHRLYGGHKKSPSVTEDELKVIIDEIEDEGVLEEKESALVRSALEFDETYAEQILVPRVNVTAVERSFEPSRIMEIFIKERYSRIPVYDKSIDNIVGILNEKDFFALYLKSGNKPGSIEEIIQKALYVPERKLISEVLYEMQRTKIHMAVVKDQYGGTSGIITMEDIIEELVGEIYDENDEEIENIVKTADNRYEIQGSLNIEDMLEGLDLPGNAIESESMTVSGWVTELFRSIPEVGTTVSDGIFRISVLEVGDRHVKKIELEINGDKDD